MGKSASTHQFFHCSNWCCNKEPVRVTGSLFHFQNIDLSVHFDHSLPSLPQVKLIGSNADAVYAWKSPHRDHQHSEVPAHAETIPCIKSLSRLNLCATCQSYVCLTLSLYVIVRVTASVMIIGTIESNLRVRCTCRKACVTSNTRSKAAPLSACTKKRGLAPL